MLGELIGEFTGKITGVRILPEGKTEMSLHGFGKVFGMDATYASTGVFTRLPAGILSEEGTGLLSTLEHDVAVDKYKRISVAAGKGRQASFRGTSYYSTESPRLGRLNSVVGVSEFETNENGDWTLKVWEWK
ncbi:MAG: hypothetical protein ACE14S_10260 [Candidatus Bathyarchaeia archaeon]